VGGELLADLGVELVEGGVDRVGVGGDEDVDVVDAPLGLRAPLLVVVGARLPGPAGGRRRARRRGERGDEETGNPAPDDLAVDAHQPSLGGTCVRTLTAAGTDGAAKP